MILHFIWHWMKTLWSIVLFMIILILGAFIYPNAIDRLNKGMDNIVTNLEKE